MLCFTDSTLASPFAYNFPVTEDQKSHADRSSIQLVPLIPLLQRPSKEFSSRACSPCGKQGTARLDKVVSEKD